MEHRANPVADRPPAPAAWRVVVAGPFPPPVGGIAAFIDNLRRHPFGPDVQVDFVDTTKGLPATAGRLRTVAAALSAVWRVALALWRTPGAALHVHTSSGRSILEKSLMVWSARLLGRRVLLHIHSGNFDVFYERSGRALRAYVRQVLRASHQVVVLSRSAARFLDARVGLSPASIAFVPNGVSAPARPTAPARTDGTLSVLLLAVVDWHKGIREFLAAARALVAEGLPARFLVAGPVAGGPAMEQELHALVAEWGLDAHVEWLGPVLGSAKWECIAGADVFALPSHNEGLPLALLEAMAMARPIVASAVGAIPEVLRDEHEALLVPPRDAEALAQALRRLLLSQPLRARLSAAALERFEREYRFSAVGERLEALYRVG